MAFESVRGPEERGVRLQRQIAFALVSVFHGALIAAGIAYSYWHVEELTPPVASPTAAVERRHELR